MSIADRIQAINDHLIDDYKVLRLAGADLTGVNKNIVNLKPTWKERLLYFMNNGTQEVWNNWDKVNGSGTSVSLNNTEEAPMSLTYKGNTSQNGTPTPSSPIPVHVVSGDNSIEVVGKNLAHDIYTYDSTAQYAQVLYFDANLEPSTTYTISFEGTVGNKLYFNENIFTTTAYGTEIVAGRTSVTLTTKSSLNKQDITQYGNGRWVIGKNSQAQSSANVFNNVQMELGNQATTYTPYQSSSYPISLGVENLLDFDTILDYWGATYTEEDNTYTLTDRGSFYANPYTLNLKAGETYSLSGNKVNQSSGNLRLEVLKDSTIVAIQRFSDEATESGHTFVVEAGHTYSIRGNYSTGVYPMIFSKPQLEKGSKVNSFTPYGTTPIELCKIGTYQDKIFKNTPNTTDYDSNLEDNVWYLKKEIGKVVLNGSESYSKSGASTDSLFIGVLQTSLGNLQINNCPCLSNYFSSNEAWKVNNLWFYNNGLMLAFGMDGTQITDVATFKTWLSTHTPTVYYVLATPTYETITDTTLLSQLEEAKKSYEEQTNITQTNNDLPFELDVVALGVM